MYVFGLVMLFGLGVVAVAMFVERYLEVAREFRAVVLVALGVALAWITGFDLWELWGFDARADWIGVSATGIILGGIAYAWHVVLGVFNGLLRKVNDEAESIEKTQGLRPAA